jgi:hypothetical protein
MRLMLGVPPELSPSARLLYLEARSEDARSYMARVAKQQAQAYAEHSAYAEKIGATGFLLGIQWLGGRPAAFVFDKKPPPGWIKASTIPPQPNGIAYGLGRGRGSSAVKDELDRLTPFVGSKEVARAARWLPTIEFEDGRQIKTGDEPGRLWFPTFGFTSDRSFLIAPNPFYDMLEDVNRHGSPPKPSSVTWRPNWQIVSKAEVDLAFAEDKARQA